MSRLVISLFGKLRKVIIRRQLIVVSVIGGLALGLSTLTGMLQNPRASDGRIDIQSNRVHDRVQRVRDALQTAEGTPANRITGSHLAQWYNWGNWSNGWNNWNNWPNR